MASRALSAAAICALLFAAGALCRSVDKRNVPGDYAGDDPDSYGERESVILLKGIYTCPSVQDESKLYGVVEEVKLDRTEATKYTASGSIKQVHGIICEDTFAMNFTLIKMESSDMESTMIQFEAANVTKLIADNPEQAEPFFSCSNFPRTCPFGEDNYSVEKYDFDIAPYRKYLPEATYKIRLAGLVNGEMIWCTIVEFAVEVD